MNEHTARTEELKQLIGLLLEKINDERRLREIYRFLNQLYCR